MKKRDIYLTEENAYLCPHCGNILIPKKEINMKFHYKFAQCTNCKTRFKIKYTKTYLLYIILTLIISALIFIPNRFFKNIINNGETFLFIYKNVFPFVWTFLLGFFTVLILRHHLYFESIDAHELKSIKKLRKKTYMYNPKLDK